MQRQAAFVLQTMITALWITTTAGAQPLPDAQLGFGPPPEGVGYFQADTGADAGRWSLPITELKADIATRPGEVVPADDAGGVFSRGVAGPTGLGRQGPPSLFMWAPSGLCYWPLYFEDVRLERYGQTYAPRVQPFISGAHFLASFTLLPLNIVLDPPLSCPYTLGYYCPGSRVKYEGRRTKDEGTGAKKQFLRFPL